MTASVESHIGRANFFCVMAKRYPGRSTRLHVLAWSLSLLIHSVVIGREITTFGKILVRDHGNGVIARSVFAEQEPRVQVVRGLRFAVRSTLLAARMAKRCPDARGIAPIGLFKSMSAVVYGESVESFRSSQPDAWLGTIVTADQGPATQILGMLSNLRCKPVAVTHFNMGPSSLTGSNRPLYHFESDFRFSDTQVEGGQAFHSTLIFDQRLPTAVQRTDARGGAPVVVLLAYTTSVWQLARLVVKLLSLRACGRISIRPHPRRVWPAVCLAALPTVDWQNSRCSEVTSAAARGDVIITTTIGTPPIAASRLPCDVYALVPLDGAVTAPTALSDVPARDSGDRPVPTLLTSMPSRSELRRFLESALVRTPLNSLRPRRWALTTEATYVPRRDHIHALNLGLSPGLSDTEGH